MTPLSFDYPISVAILYYSGHAADIKDNEDSADHIEEALESMGHMVRKVRVDKKNWRKAVRTAGEVVFNLVEDENWDLYLKVGTALEKMGRAQVGHDIKMIKNTVNKAWVKRRMRRLGLPTPRFRIFNRKSDIRDVRGMDYPLIVKPSRQHASVGISQDSVVIDQTELQERVKYLFKNFPGEVIVEEFIDGTEYCAIVVGNGSHTIAMPITERNFVGEFADNWDIYTYEAKWDETSWEHWSTNLRCPASLGRKALGKLERIAVRAYKAFSCRDIARFDIRKDKAGKLYLLDVNMNPAIDFNEQEETWRSAKALGWTYGEFIETIVAIAYKRKWGRLPNRVSERHFLLAAPF